MAVGMASLGALIALTAGAPVSLSASAVSSDQLTLTSRSVNAVACVRKKPNGVCVYHCDVTDHYTSAVSGDPVMEGAGIFELTEDVSYCFRQRYPDGPTPSDDPFNLEGEDCESACAPAVASMCCDPLGPSECPR